MRKRTPFFFFVDFCINIFSHSDDQELFSRRNAFIILWSEGSHANKHFHTLKTAPNTTRKMGFGYKIKDTNEEFVPL